MNQTLDRSARRMGGCRGKAGAARTLALLLGATAGSASGSHAQTVTKPDAIMTENVPPIPEELAKDVQPYVSYRGVLSAKWHPVDRSLLVSTDVSGLPQLHRVKMPLGMREQITFETEPVMEATYSPADGFLVIIKDEGGNEQRQFMGLADGRTIKITNGGRNQFGGWSNDGKLIGYSSTRRDTRNFDIYTVDPRHPESDRLVLKRDGNWYFSGFFPGDTSALIDEFVDGQDNLYEVRLADGALRPIRKNQGRALQDIRVDSTGRIWALGPNQAGLTQLGLIDRNGGSFTPVTNEKWGVETYSATTDGATVAYSVNQAGSSTIKLRKTASGETRTVTALPAGMIKELSMAPWGQLAVTMSSARLPLDTYVVDSNTVAVTPWVKGETGGIDARRFVEPQLIEMRSFDGVEMSGFLYQPDPARFPGKRPVIVDIHGGPESQARPRFQFDRNYFLDKLGIAIFYPNDRGSSGYGAAFAALDDGPFKRENSIRDIGAFLDRLASVPTLDMTRVGVTGGSYGGYMCYASLIYFADRLKAGICEIAPASLVTTLENMADYRRAMRRVEYGDERDPVQRKKLLEISPLTRANEIKVPLMVVTGANDPRVPISEPTQMLAAVKKAGRPAWHVLAKNEGHGFHRKENENYRVLATAVFWKQFLLGEPLLRQKEGD
jgi:dipeptidyl aminopeptidase/acylaminoacyl peptidase